MSDPAFKRLVLVSAGAFLTWFLLLWLITAIGCGPMVSGGSGQSGSKHFVVTVYNNDIAFAETASISWWTGSAITGTQTKLMPAGGFIQFDLGDSRPQGLEIDTNAWPAMAGGNVFGGPDYAAGWAFHVTYPQGYAWVTTK